MNDEGYLLLAIADDFLEEFGGDVLFDLDAAYDWLIRKAHEVGGPTDVLPTLPVTTTEGQ